ncbi:MAG: hypothetical protein AAGE59_16330 [Cyanobacteria bacterium P01_F01_bin.86]
MSDLSDLFPYDQRYPHCRGDRSQHKPGDDKGRDGIIQGVAALVQ